MIDIPRRADGGIDFNFRPQTPEQMFYCLQDAMWRVCSGALYKIMIKGDNDEDVLVQEFKPNAAQMRLIKRLWYRNIILKARQLGFTTLICILWLDHALFNADTRCGIIAQDKEAVQKIFRDKVQFAYEKLPDVLKNAMPLARSNASELLFGHNNSSIKVATSMRSGTIHRLLVSEFGKICHMFPIKAAEVVTGSLPAVPKNGMVVIESTAEGQDGDFFNMTQSAKKVKELGRKLAQKEYRLHFAPWFDEPHYRVNPDDVVMTDKDHKYFDELEAKLNVSLDLQQRAWYVSERDVTFSGNPQKMWQEYPSFVDEAFQVSKEGCYYAEQMTIVRKQGRITTVKYTQGVPVNTFWDIGSSDGCGIWLHQRVGLQDRFIGYVEGWGEPYAFYVKKLQTTGYVWGKHCLPHDAGHVRQGQVANTSPMKMLQDLGLRDIVIVNRVQDLQQGIQITRDVLVGDVWFDATECKEGIAHLDGYTKSWSQHRGTWSDEPLKNIHTEGADSFRQFPQAMAQGLLNVKVIPKSTQRGRRGGWMS
ncbi:terminase [Aquirhabdus parva]|nr:terminase [Aquirhabdus parva]